jgi:Arc/MetJ family transcription regulator
MRTTIHLPDDLLAQAKRAALESGTTLTAVIEEALRERLARRTGSSTTPVRLTTFGGSGPKPGVDLDNSAALLDFMERSDAAAGC